MNNHDNKNRLFHPVEMEPVQDALASIDITDAEFNSIRSFIYEFFGINLTFRKKSLVKGRMQHYLKANGFTSFSDYIAFLESDGSGTAVNELINRISTNYTYFFRESQQFEFLFKEAFPAIIKMHEKNSDRDIRLWSAGCSTGDEAYSLLITIMEFLGENYSDWDAGILATDVCETVLSEGRKAIYSYDKLNGLDAGLVEKYFQKMPDGYYQIKPELKNEVIFRRFNLVNRVFPFKKQFEIIMCRNVMIYFDSQTRDNLINKLYNLTKPGGYLFVGSSESFNRILSPYVFIQPGVYRRDEQGE